jgi:uncharacterized protein (TIGR04255 family)
VGGCGGLTRHTLTGKWLDEGSSARYPYDMADPIPSFDSPPINEVVMGLQYHPIRQFNVQQCLDYWLRIRDRYPKIEDQAPLLHVKEAQTPFAMGADVDEHIVKLSKLSPRYWLIDKSGNELIQVQQDRFLRNWRQIQGDENYPRFDPLFEHFWREWQIFREFVRGGKLGEIKVDQCELSYINHIVPDQEWSGFSGLPDVFSVLQHQERKAFLPAPELFNWQSRYALPDSIGRLHVEVGPTFRARDLKLVISFTLTARGEASETSDDKLKAWFCSAHEWIVRGFEELTTSTMHKVWRKVT